MGECPQFVYVMTVALSPRAVAIRCLSPFLMSLRVSVIACAKKNEESGESADAYAVTYNGTELTLGADAAGVCAENLKYPLRDAVLPAHTTLGVSNEFLPGLAARVALARGSLLLVWQQPWKEKNKK